jgi:hypothetical protein
MTALSGIRRRVQKLGPYQSLILILLPLLLVEPLKLVALVIAGKGPLAGRNWNDYRSLRVSFAWNDFSLKPKLLMLKWFAKGWTCFSGFRDKTIAWGERLMTSRESQ